MDAQQQLFGLMAVAEEQQKAVQAAIDGLKQERREFSRTVNDTTEQIASNLSGAATVAQQKSDAAIDRFQNKWSAIIWKTAVAAVVTVSAICGFVAWAQRYHVGELLERKAALTEEVAALEIQAAALAKKGGRIVYSTCGGRLCIEANNNQGESAEQWKGANYYNKETGQQFIIPKGY